jgi:hypothetical protein
VLRLARRGAVSVEDTVLAWRQDHAHATPHPRTLGLAEMLLDLDAPLDPLVSPRPNPAAILAPRPPTHGKVKKRLKGFRP